MGIRLTPQDPRFFDLFAASSRHLVDGAAELTALLGAELLFETEVTKSREPHAPDLVALRGRVLGIGLEVQPLEKELQAQTSSRHVDRIPRIHGPLVPLKATSDEGLVCGDTVDAI